MPEKRKGGGVRRQRTNKQRRRASKHDTKQNPNLRFALRENQPEPRILESDRPFHSSLLFGFLIMIIIALIIDLVIELIVSKGGGKVAHHQ